MIKHDWVKISEVMTPEGRYYKLENTGVTVPSVTTILSNTSGDSLKHFRSKYPDVLEKAAARGTEFHRLVEQYILTKKIEQDSPSYPWFRLVRKLLDNIEIHFIEAPVISLKYGFAGRGDCGMTFNGNPLFLDWKSKDRHNGKLYDYPLQLAAYIHGFAESYPNFPVKFKEALIVTVTPKEVKHTLLTEEDIAINWEMFKNRVEHFNRKFSHV